MYRALSVVAHHMADVLYAFDQIGQNGCLSPPTMPAGLFVAEQGKRMLSVVSETAQPDLESWCLVPSAASGV